MTKSELNTLYGMNAERVSTSRKTSKFAPYLEDDCPFDTSTVLTLASLLADADDEFSDVSYDVCCCPRIGSGLEIRIFPSADKVCDYEYRSLRSLPATGHKAARWKRWSLIAQIYGRHDPMNAREYVERALELISAWMEIERSCLS